EYRSLMGAMVTDFRMIKPGALQRANGGYLVLNAADLLSAPFAWASLKRALSTRQLRIENMSDQFTLLPAASLQPDPIPLEVKVVLIGQPQTYSLLHFYDEDFSKLFRVRADFDTEIERDGETLAGYAALIASEVRELGLKHFDRSAVAKVAEFGARAVEDQGKLSASLDQLVELLAEASYLAHKDASAYVQSQHVRAAAERRVYRNNLVEDKIRDFIRDGTILIDTAGSRIGQVNGLSVLDMGDYSFGRPVRITAQTALGAEGVADIDRETQLSGRLHSKGFLILTSLLLARYGQDKPVAVSARLTFEQTYDEVDGDSASCAELCCLLSSLSGIPLRQDVAMTGSVNQLGEVQAIGGATRKIEGFFDVCKLRGLSGSQGVILPASNVNNLMLREDVVEAVKAGQFHIWGIRTVDEALELLTGLTAAEVDAAVNRRLGEFADRLKSFGRATDHSNGRERTPAAVGPRTPRVRRVSAI
ncbi:MAG: Lon protease family protein, partial [Chloroflexi bacterium]|nr:Lon protease family protein [Chloroflexota bacterium]